MARTLYNNFTSGEVDPKLDQRSDNKHYFNGAKLMRNVIVLPQGGFRPRWGTIYKGTVPRNGLGELADTRLIAFRFSTVQHYLMMFIDLAVKIFKFGVEQVEKVTPLADTTLDDIAWTQSLDSLLVFHEDHATQLIQRQGSDILWGVSAWPYKNIPRFAFGDTVYVNGVDEIQKIEFPSPTGGVWAAGDIFTLSLGGEETNNILYTAVAADLATAIQTALRNLPGTSATGITVTQAAGTYTVTFSGDDGQQAWGAMGFDIKNSAEVPEVRVWVEVEGEPPGEDSWSDARGWPRCGKFFQGRLWVAGSSQRPSTAWGSFAGDPTDFNNKTTDDDYGLEATADTEDVASFVAIFSGRHLQFFSSSGEFYVPISDEDPITPLNMVLRSTTNRGSKKGLPVFEIEGATQFMQTDKGDPPIAKTLREYIFSDGEQAYQANPISLLASHLIRDPRRLSVRRASSTEDADYVLMSNATDGSMAVFCTLRTQEVNAFTLLTTEGSFTDVGVDGDDIYAIAERTLGSNDPERFLEQLSFGVYLDCATVAADLGAPVASVTGLDRFEGATVGVFVDGLWQAPVVVVGGTVALDPPAEDSYQIGLLWPVVDEATGFRFMVETLPPIYDLVDGPSVGKKARIVEITAAVEGMQGLVVGNNRFTSQRFGAALLDQAPPLFTGQWRRKGLKGHSLFRTLKIGDTLPGPGVVKSIAAKVSI